MHLLFLIKKNKVLIFCPIFFTEYPTTGPNPVNKKSVKLRPHILPAKDLERERNKV